MILQNCRIQLRKCRELNTPVSCILGDTFLNNEGGAVTTESYSETDQETEAIKPAGYFSILSSLFFSPGKAFQEVNRSPRLLWPIIGLIVISLLAGFIMSNKFDFEAMMAAQTDAAVAQGRMTRQEADQQMQAVESRMGVISKVVKIVIIIVIPIGSMIFALIAAGVIKLISLLVGAENSFKGVFAVAILALTPYYIVYYGLFALIVTFKGAGGMSPTDMAAVVASNLGALLTSAFGNDALPKYLINLCHFIDIFAIWEIALLSIGCAAVSKKLKTSTMAIWISSIYAVFAILIAAGRTMMGQ
jgi:hypothetical protein